MATAASNTGLEVSELSPYLGDEITLTATASCAADTPTGTVTFTAGGGTLGSATLDGSGRASLATSTLAPGAHSVTASYQGDSAHEPSASTPVEVNVGRAGSTTALEASDTSTYPGEEITFTASVSCALGTPTGTVTFSDGPTSLGSATLDGSGEAALATSALALGTHAITADYGGDTLCGPSASSELGVAVAAAPAVDTTLILTVNPEAGPARRHLHAHRHPDSGLGPGHYRLHCRRGPVGHRPSRRRSGRDRGVRRGHRRGRDRRLLCRGRGIRSAQAAGISAAVEEPGLGLDSATAAAGGKITVTGAGFAPGGTLQVWLHSDPILLGEVVADTDGRFTAVFTLPAGLTGEHEIRVVGESASGETLEAMTGLAIAADAFDPPTCCLSPAAAPR